MSALPYAASTLAGIRVVLDTFCETVHRERGGVLAVGASVRTPGTVRPGDLVDVR